MSDKELLEWAAKAAGMEDWQWSEESGALCHMNKQMGCWYVDYYGDRIKWHPLTSDGDALRLAVKLHLLFGPELPHFLSLERFAGQDRDDCSAHRRAIVRTAAELGKAKP